MANSPAREAVFEQATTEVAPQDFFDALWTVPMDPVAWSHIYLAGDRMLQGDLAGAEARLSQAVWARRASSGFSLDTYNHVVGTAKRDRIRCEAGQLDRARAVASQMIEQAERARVRLLATVRRARTVRHRRTRPAGVRRSGSGRVDGSHHDHDHYPGCAAPHRR